MDQAETVRASITILWKGMAGMFVIAAVMAGLTTAIIKWCRRATPPS